MDILNLNLKARISKTSWKAFNTWFTSTRLIEVINQNFVRMLCKVLLPCKEVRERLFYEVLKHMLKSGKTRLHQAAVKTAGYL